MDSEPFLIKSFYYFNTDSKSIFYLYKISKTNRVVNDSLSPFI